MQKEVILRFCFWCFIKIVTHQSLRVQPLCHPCSVNSYRTGLKTVVMKFELVRQPSAEGVSSAQVKVHNPSKLCAEWPHGLGWGTWWRLPAAFTNLDPLLKSVCCSHRRSRSRSFLSFSPVFTTRWGNMNVPVGWWRHRLCSRELWWILQHRQRGEGWEWGEGICCHGERFLKQLPIRVCHSSPLPFSCLSLLPPAIQARGSYATRASLDLPASDLLCCSPHTGMGDAVSRTQREDTCR